MAEKFLTTNDVACRLGVVRRTVERNMPKLMAKGLQRIRMGKRLVRFTESSLDALIQRASDSGERLY